jgi:hypothetical protein
MNRLIAIFALIVVCSLPSRAQVNPCSLLTPAEIESALGVKVSAFTGGSPMGGTRMCSGAGAKHMMVMMSFSAADAQKANDPKWVDPLGELERLSRESAKPIGAQVEAKRFGDNILCTTLVPPKQGPYSTQCMVVKKPTGMASIGVLVATQPDMVPMEKLRPLAEKMLGRF